MLFVQEPFSDENLAFFRGNGQNEKNGHFRYRIFM